MQRGIHPPRIHELDKLIIEVCAASYEFPSFARECESLNPYAATIRYPEQAPIPDEAGGRAVIEAAWRIVDAAKSRLDT